MSLTPEGETKATGAGKNIHGGSGGVKDKSTPLTVFEMVYSFRMFPPCC